MSTINQRLQLLRKTMKEKQIDAYIIPSSDAHQSEYVAARFQGREWISGFDGSAGLVIVTENHAGLWTDGRYFTQAEKQLSTSEFELHKIKNRNLPEHILWVIENLPAKSVVACDGMLFSKGQIDQYQKLLTQVSIALKPNFSLLESIWLDRPDFPQSKVYEHDIKYAGISRKAKIALLRTQFINHADHYVVTALDDIAWLLNLRAQDVEYNPVFYAYIVLDKEHCNLFIDGNKLSEEISADLATDNVKIHEYAEIVSYLNNMSEGDRVHYVSSEISYGLFMSINGVCIKGENYIQHAKGVKNETEISHIRHAMCKDGAALTRTFMWLEQQLKERRVKETEVRSQLQHFRSQQEGYIGESFGAIVGFKGNGAIIHYSPEESDCAEIENNGMLLVDSGGQYLDGTTDITRTFHLGTPTKEEKIAFTMVLKGYISLDRVQYPAGTMGVQIDILARMHLWQQGMDYGHGTGHGVGFLLNVHEGPQGIANAYGGRSKTPLKEGMVTSNEPGFYKEGAYGIRMENLILTVKSEETEYGQFLKHETLSMYPIEIKLIEETLMDAKEKAWFNKYHQKVYQRISPLLTEEEKKWLSIKCRPLN